MSRKAYPIPPEIVDYLDYNPETGIITWKMIPPNSTKIKIGQEAGSLNKQGYRRIKFKEKEFKYHRLAYFIYHGVDPLEKYIDHIDGNPLNNKIDNLRLVNQSQNLMNRGLPKNNKSGVIGVHWCKREQKWRATIQYEGKYLHLGYFDDKEEAIAVRVAAKKKYHGEYARDYNENV